KIIKHVAGILEFEPRNGERDEAESPVLICQFRLFVSHQHALVEVKREIGSREANYNARKKYKPLASDTAFDCRFHPRLTDSITPGRECVADKHSILTPR